MTRAVVEPTVVPEWELCDRLRKIRISIAKAGGRGFAQQLGVNYSRYAAWETGRTQPRDLVAIAKRIELLTGVPAAWTLGVDQPPTPDSDTAMAPYAGGYADTVSGSAQVIELWPPHLHGVAVALPDAAPRVNLDLSA